jgi:hypothetical protein
MLIGNSEILLACVCKSLGSAWSEAVISEIISYKRKSILAGDLNAKHPFWNSEISNLSGEKLMALFDLTEFEISAPQCSTHYSSAGNGDVLNILDSDHLQIIFHIRDHIKIRNSSEPIEKFTDWDRFQNVASELISHRIEINWGQKPIKRRATFQPLLLQHIGWRPVKLHYRT